MCEAFEDMTAMPGLWSNYEKDAHPLFGPQDNSTTSSDSDAAPAPMATPGSEGAIPPSPPPAEQSPVEVSDDAALRARGVCRCQINGIDLDCWAKELSKVTPMSLAMEDGEYAQYRNILEDTDPAFPFATVFEALTPMLEKHFVGGPAATALRLDDAFAIHYNETHLDTKVKRHTDPSDVTVNLCLERSDNLEGSQVLFFGRKTLLGLENEGNAGDPCGNEDSKVQSIAAGTLTEATQEQFLVGAESGWATVHWGAHPHLVTDLRKGQRTNVVLTYCFTEAGRSTAMKGLID